jgi:hypothetical protein
VRTFGTMTANLLALDDWLGFHQVTHVAMESTGVLWPLIAMDLNYSPRVCCHSCAHPLWPWGAGCLQASRTPREAISGRAASLRSPARSRGASLPL